MFYLICFSPPQRQLSCPRRLINSPGKFGNCFLNFFFFVFQHESESSASIASGLELPPKPDDELLPVCLIVVVFCIYFSLFWKIWKIQSVLYLNYLLEQLLPSLVDGWIYFSESAAVNLLLLSFTLYYITLYYSGKHFILIFFAWTTVAKSLFATARNRSL